jgi:hypothetical protein
VGTLSRVVNRLVREVGLPRVDSVRIARKLNRLAKSVDWATPLDDDLDKSGRKRRASSLKLSASSKLSASRKRAVVSNKNSRRRQPAAKKKTRK